MTFPALNLFFPVVLGIHNIEECVQYDNFARTFHGKLPPKLATRQVARDSSTYLTLSAALVSALTYTLRSPALVKTSQIATFGLMLNGFGHCVLSLKRQVIVAGAWSALAIVLPYSAVAVITMRKDLGSSFFSLLRCAVLGAVVAPLVILSFLLTSYGIPLRALRLIPSSTTPSSDRNEI